MDVDAIEAKKETVVGASRTARAVLSRSSPEPLYRQLASHLENEIRSGRLERGDRLESEGLLAARFQVSRITLRQAVAELVRTQLLVRKQGKGTFVTIPAVQHDLRRSHGLLGSLCSQARGASARRAGIEQWTERPAHTARAVGLRQRESRSPQPCQRREQTRASANNGHATLPSMRRRARRLRPTRRRDKTTRRVGRCRFW